MTAPRERIEPHKRSGRRDEQARFDGIDDAGRSLARDVRLPARMAAKTGQGDTGDRQRG